MRTKFPPVLAIVSVVLLVLTRSGSAGLFTWDGGDLVDNNWGSETNWAFDTGAPASGDSLVFAGSTRTANNNNLAANIQINGITFASTAGSFVLGGNAVNLTGDVTNNSVNSQTISLPVILDGGNRAFNTANGDVIVGMGIGEGGGPYGVTKTGAKTLTLNGNNTYTGSTVVNAGTLNGSGSVAGPLTVNGGTVTGSLTANNGATVSGGTVNGSVIINNGATVTSGSIGGNAQVYGGVLVNGGAVNGSAIIHNGATVNSGGQIGGTVNVTGSLRVNSGGTTTPGDNGVAGTLTADSAVLNGGGIYHWDRLSAGGPGTGWDLLSISGSLDLLSLTPSSKFIFDIYGTSALGSYVVATASSITGFNASDFTLINYAGGSGWWSLNQITYGSGQALELTYSVPEPNLLALLGLGSMLVARKFWHSRRRSQRQINA